MGTRTKRPIFICFIFTSAWRVVRNNLMHLSIVGVMHGHEYIHDDLCTSLIESPSTK
jgi:hypothetical protein